MMRIGLVGSMLLGLSACGSPPVAADLYGMWSNVADDGTVRVIDCAATATDADLSGLSDVFHIYNYPQGTSPVEVQHGTYVVSKGDGWEFVTTVVWSADGNYVGQSFGNPIAKLDDTTLELKLDDGTTRVYTAADAMP